MVKLSDDYYTLRVPEKFNHLPSGGIIGSTIYVKCDGIDGLVECISDMINNKIDAEWDTSDPDCTPWVEEEEEEEEEYIEPDDDSE